MASRRRNSGAFSGASSALVGQTIGDFEILEEIGRGGMGVVFRARQMSLDRIVALKILSGNLGLTEHAIERFRREAQATARLYHPNIVPIYAQGQEGQTYYYAMQLVSGTSLHDMLTEMRGGASPTADTVSHGSSSRSSSDAMALAETEVLERGDGAAPSTPRPDDSAARRMNDGRFNRFTPSYFDEVARQIHGVADALDFAHRHGVIHRDIKPHNLLIGDQERLCLSDFGLARVLEQPGVTMTGEFVGSPLYMSPEQMSGKAGQIGPNTDIYSLGATLFEWLTLRPPFPGQSREEVISKVLTTDAPSPRSLNPRIPLDLETICQKALEKDPSRRYRSAADMRDDLRLFLDRGAIKARRAGPVATLAKMVSRRPVETTIAVAAVLIVALSLLLFRERQENRRRDSFEPAAVAQASPQPEVPPVTAPQTTAADPTDELAQAIGLGENLGKDLANTFNLSGLLSTASEEGAERGQPVSDAQRVGAMFLTYLRATESRRVRRLDTDTVDEDYVRALTGTESAADALALLNACIEDAPEFIEARLLRAWIHCQMEDFDAMLQEANVIERIDPRRAESDAVRGAALLLTGRYGSAVGALTRASSAFTAEYRLDVLQGMALAKQGRTDAASAALGRALILAPDSVLALKHRADLSYATGHFEYAVVDLTRALALEPDNADMLERRGECYDKLERYELSLADYTRALPLSGNWSQLVAKLAAAAANRDQQRLARESRETGTPHDDQDTNAPSEPTAPAADATNALEHQLNGMLDPPHPAARQGAAPLGRTAEILPW